MKAAVIEHPGVMGVREVPDPTPGEYDCLCQMLYGATCSATDQHMIDGKLPFPILYPTIFGHESVGRVIAVGSKVRNFRMGDLVSRVGAMDYPDGTMHANWGGFAELGLARDHKAMSEDGCPQKEWDWFRTNQVIPADLDPRACCMLITWRETLSYVCRMGLGRGSRVLVIGSGGNGLAFAAHARNLGAAQVCLIGSAARLETGLRAGADIYMDYRNPELAVDIRAVAAEPFDFIVDAVGKKGMLDRVLGLLRPGGMLGVYGIDDFAEYGINPFKAAGTFTIYNGGYDEEETHGQVLDFMRAGKLDAGVWLDLERPFTLAQIGQAMEAVAARKLVKALVRLS